VLWQSRVEKKVGIEEAKEEIYGYYASGIITQEDYSLGVIRSIFCSACLAVSCVCNVKA